MTSAPRLTLHLAMAALAGYAGAAYHASTHPAAAPHSPAAWMIRTATTVSSQAPGLAASQRTARVAGTSQREAAARAGASVVTVYCTTTLGAGPRTPSTALAVASGVVVDRDGLVVTTSELAALPGKVFVGLPDGSRRPARLLGTDRGAGLALLKVDGLAMEPIEMAAPGSAAVGDTVLALGDAFGLGLTVTQGIVSAVRPAELQGSAPVEFIQTDAAIHRGNFGGALVDTAGRLVGINLGVVGDDAPGGLAFAVPAERVARVSAQLRLAAGAQPSRPPQSHDGSRFTEISDKVPSPDAALSSARAHRLDALSSKSPARNTSRPRPAARARTAL